VFFNTFQPAHILANQIKALDKKYSNCTSLSLPPPTLHPPRIVFIITTIRNSMGIRRTGAMPPSKPVWPGYSTTSSHADLKSAKSVNMIACFGGFAPARPDCTRRFPRRGPFHALSRTADFAINWGLSQIGGSRVTLLQLKLMCVPFTCIVKPALRPSCLVNVVVALPPWRRICTPALFLCGGFL
jgi:hypothetical protein